MEGWERKLSYPIVIIYLDSYPDIDCTYENCEDWNENYLPSGEELLVLSTLVEENDPNQDIDDVKGPMDGVVFN